MRCSPPSVSRTETEYNHKEPGLWQGCGREPEWTAQVHYCICAFFILSEAQLLFTAIGANSNDGLP